MKSRKLPRGVWPGGECARRAAAAALALALTAAGPFPWVYAGTEDSATFENASSSEISNNAEDSGTETESNHGGASSPDGPSDTGGESGATDNQGPPRETEGGGEADASDQKEEGREPEGPGISAKPGEQGSDAGIPNPGEPGTDGRPGELLPPDQPSGPPQPAEPPDKTEPTIPPGGQQPADSEQPLPPAEEEETSAPAEEGAVVPAEEIPSPGPQPVLDVEIPQTFSFVIDPFEIAGKGQVYSEPFRFVNHGETDVAVHIRSAYYEFGGGGDFEPLMSDQIKNGGEKSIYAYLHHWKEGEGEPENAGPEIDLVIGSLGEGEEYTFLLSAAHKPENDVEDTENGGSESSEAVFSLHGAVNPFPARFWEDGDVKLCLEITVEPVNLAELPPQEEEQEKLQDAAGPETEKDAGTDIGAAPPESFNPPENTEPSFPGDQTQEELENQEPGAGDGGASGGPEELPPANKPEAPDENLKPPEEGTEGETAKEDGPDGTIEEPSSQPEENTDAGGEADGNRAEDTGSAEGEGTAGESNSSGTGGETAGGVGTESDSSPQGSEASPNEAVGEPDTAETGNGPEHQAQEGDATE